MGDLERFGFEIEGQDSFEKLLRASPDRLSRALFRGTRRSLAGFRKDFLAKVPVNIKGKRSTPSAARGRNIGRSFIWEMEPKSEASVSRRTRDIGGVIYTNSRAAKGLEIGGTVRPDESQFLAIPISEPFGDNHGSRGIKPSWKSMKNVLATKRRTYRFLYIRTSRGTIVKAQKRRPRGGDQRAFPIFFLTKSLTTEPGRLRYYRTWDSASNARKIERRVMQEIDKELRQITREGRGRGR